MPKYLSDQITLTFELDEQYTGQNVKYVVYDYPSNETLYVGSVYATGKPQKLYLNDIIYNLTDDYKWFREAIEGNIHNAPHSTTLKIVFDTSKETTYYVNDIIHATRVPNMTNIYYVPDDAEDEIVPFNYWGTGVLPRIPRLTDSYTNFFGAVMIMYSQFVASQNAEWGLCVYDDEGEGGVVDWLIGDVVNDNGVTKYCIKDDFFVDLTRFFERNTTLKNCTLGIHGDGQDCSTSRCVICNFDNEPADYYVSWINRYGAWQCQPLCAKYEMKEKVSTTNIVSLADETIPYVKTSDFSWTLNTHWLTYAEHDEFESILQSKYVYLYNTKTKEGHYVNVTDSSWTFKNGVNTKKPFNLTLNLTKSYKQTVVY